MLTSTEALAYYALCLVILVYQLIKTVSLIRHTKRLGFDWPRPLYETKLYWIVLAAWSLPFVNVVVFIAYVYLKFNNPIFPKKL